MIEKLIPFFISGFFAVSCSQRATQQQVSAPMRENIEWLDVWLPNTNDNELPRVLLIGNSITRAYYTEVQSLLEGKAYVGRLATSKSVGDLALLAEVALVLSTDTFDVVHFNNGLHGWGYTEEEYRKGFPDFINTIKTYAPKARLIWASTTPVRTGKGMMDFDPKTERVKARNRIAVNAIEEQDIAIDDLYQLVEGNPAYYAGGDGTHLMPLGVTVMAKQVASAIMGAIAQ